MTGRDDGAAAACYAAAMAPNTDTSDTAPADDPLAAEILTLAAEHGTIGPQDVARRIAAARARPKDPPDLWRRYLTPVKQQGLHLARQGRIEIVRNGRAVPPDQAKGLYRYRLPGG
jgi:hypothetical protein